jgi:hypothetical protein
MKSIPGRPQLRARVKEEKLTFKGGLQEKKYCNTIPAVTERE